MNVIDRYFSDKTSQEQPKQEFSEADVKAADIIALPKLNAHIAANP